MPCTRLVWATGSWRMRPHWLQPPWIGCLHKAAKQAYPATTEETVWGLAVGKWLGERKVRGKRHPSSWLPLGPHFIPQPLTDRSHTPALGQPLALGMSRGKRMKLGGMEMCPVPAPSRAHGTLQPSLLNFLASQHHMLSSELCSSGPECPSVPPMLQTHRSTSFLCLRFPT